MLRAEIRWTGGPGGNGVSVLNFDGALPSSTDDLLDPLDDFATAVATQLPSAVTLQVSNQVEVRAESTGNLIAVATGTGQTPRVGGVTSYNQAAGVGSRIRWATNGIRNGRAVVGTTFVVPLPTQFYEPNGTLTSAHIGALQAAGAALVSACAAGGFPLAVWSRPAPAGSDGFLSEVTAVLVPDQVSWLTTRRS